MKSTIHLKKIRRWVMAFAIALSVFSNLARGEYVPIAVGDEWTMEATIVSPKGQITKGIVHRKIESGPLKDGKVYVRSRTWSEGLPKKTDSTKLIRKDADAVYSIGENDPGSAEQIEVVLPLKAGLTWKQIVESTTMTNTVIGSESVEVSDKTYQDCYHIHISSSDGSYTEDFWEAPRVGNVKSIITYGNGVKFTLLLQEFRAGG